MGTFLPERIWAVDQKQPRFFDPGRWHKQRRCDDCTGHLWKTDDHMRICPLSPPPTLAVETSLAWSRRSLVSVPDVDLGFCCFHRLSFNYFFHPFSPPVALFYSSPAPVPGQSLTRPGDKCMGANAAFLSFSLWCEGQGDVPNFCHLLRSSL